MSADRVQVVVGAGPVGSTLALRLAGEGHRVRIVTRSGRGPAHELIERHAADITEPGAAVAACDGADAVYGCANTAYTAAAWRRTWPLLQAGALAGAGAAGARYVAVENLYTYGELDGVRTEETPLAATGPKGRLRVELSRALLDQHDVPAASVRAGDFVGPFVRDAHAGERFVPRLLAGKGVRVVGDPDAPHAFTYVPDLVDAMVAVAGSADAMGRAWHAPMTTVTQRQLAEAIGGPGAKVGTYPSWAFNALRLVVPFVRELEEVRYQFDRPFLADSSAIAGALGVTATPLTAQVEATVAWWQTSEVAAAA